MKTLTELVHVRGTCDICGITFLTGDPSRAGLRHINSRTCGKPECKREFRKRKSQEWRNNHPDYDAKKKKEAYHRAFDNEEIHHLNDWEKEKLRNHRPNEKDLWLEILMKLDVQFNFNRDILFSYLEAELGYHYFPKKILYQLLKTPPTDGLLKVIAKKLREDPTFWDQILQLRYQSYDYQNMKLGSKELEPWEFEQIRSRRSHK